MPLTLALNLTGDSAALVKSLADAKKGLDGVGDAARGAGGAAGFDQLGQGAQQAAAALEALRKKYDPTAAAAAAFAKNQALVNDAVAANKLAPAEATTLLANMGKELNSAAKATEEFGAAHEHATGQASRMREGMVLVHEFIRGDWKRAVGSATIELQNFGVMHTIVSAALSPLGIGIAAVAGVVGLLGVSLHAGIAEQKAFDLAVRTTGAGLGISGASLREFADDVANASGASLGEAKTVTLELAKMAKLGPESFGVIARASRDFGAAIGTDAAGGAKALGDALADPIKGLDKIDEVTHVATASLREYVKGLVDQGREEAARVVVAEAVGKSVQGLAENQYNLLGRVLHGVADQADRLWQGLKNIGQADTPMDKIVSLSRQIGNLQQPGGGVAALNKPGLTQEQKMGLANVAYTPGANPPGGVSSEYTRFNDERDALIEDQRRGNQRSVIGGDAIRRQGTMTAGLGVANKLDPDSAAIKNLSDDYNKLQSALSAANAQGLQNTADYAKLSGATDIAKQKLDGYVSSSALARMELNQHSLALTAHTVQQKREVELGQIQIDYLKNLAAGMEPATALELKSIATKNANIKATQELGAAGQKTADELAKLSFSETDAAITKATDSMKGFTAQVGLKELDPGKKLLEEYSQKLVALDVSLEGSKQGLEALTKAEASAKAMGESTASFERDRKKLLDDVAKGESAKAQAIGASTLVQQTANDLSKDAHDTAFRTLTDLQAEVDATDGGAASLLKYNETKRYATLYAQEYARILEYEKKQNLDLADAQAIANAKASEAVGLQKQLDQRRDAADAQQKFYNDEKEMAKSTATDVTRFLVDGFANVEKGGGSAFKSIWDGALAGAKRLVVQIAGEFLKQTLILPITTQLVGSMPGAFGITQPAGATGSGSPGLGDVLGLGKNLFGNVGSSISSGLDQLGSFFGIGQTALGAGETAAGMAAISAAAPTATITSAMSTAGAASTGMIGGLGSMLAGAAPYIGGAVMLATLLAGNKPPQHRNWNDIDSVGADGTLSQLTAGGDHPAAGQHEQADQKIATLQTLLQSVSTTTGADFSSIGAHVNYKTEATDGGGTISQFGLTTKADTSDETAKRFEDSDAGLTQLTLTLLKSADGLSSTTKTILDHTQAQSTAALQADLAFGKAFDTLDQTLAAVGQPVSAYTAQLAQLKATYDTQSATAKALGLDVSKLTTLYQAQSKQLTTDFDRGLTNQARAANGQDFLNAVDDVLSKAKANAADASALGVDRTGQIAQITNATLAAQFAKLDDTSLKAIEAAYGDNATVIKQANAALATLADTAHATAQSQQDAAILNMRIAMAGPTVAEFTSNMQNTAAAFSAAAAAANDNAASLKAWAQQLTLGALSPLSGAAKARQAKALYEQSGSTQSAEAYLTALSDSAGRSSQTYADAYQEVLNRTLGQGASSAYSAAYNNSLAGTYSRIAQAGGALGIGDQNYANADQAGRSARDAYQASTGILTDTGAGTAEVVDSITSLTAQVVQLQALLARQGTFNSGIVQSVVALSTDNRRAG